MIFPYYSLYQYGLTYSWKRAKQLLGSLPLDIMLPGFTLEGFSKEVLLKGKAQYSWLPCTNLLRLAPFYIVKFFHLFYKTSYLNEEVNCIDPSRSVSTPWGFSVLTSTGMLSLNQYSQHKNTKFWDSASLFYD
jgi:hypothetical protein